MDAATNTIIAGQYDVRENSEPELNAFFTSLQDRGFAPHSFTVDGNPQVIRVVRKRWSDITIQRCLVHVQRQGLMWCRRYPKRAEAQTLRALFLQVTSITTSAKRDLFLHAVTQWEGHYGHRIQERKETGWVFPDLKRARHMLLTALPDMFHYLENPAIPCTTNALEGYFSRLKRHYRGHRGLKRSSWKQYFSWYFFLRQK